MIPRDDLTVIINAYDTEFIDLCAVFNRNNFWIRIFTTERGYGTNQQQGRNFGAMDNQVIAGKLRISSKNSKTRIKDLWILTQPNNNKIVTFQSPGYLILYASFLKSAFR
jgi:hypothetical protein